MDALKYVKDTGKNIIYINGWAGWGEGFGIADSFEYGRKYIDLTRYYTGLFYRQDYSAGFSFTKYDLEESTFFSPTKTS